MNQMYKDVDVGLKKLFDECLAKAKEQEIDPEEFTRTIISLFLFHANAMGISAWGTTDPPQPMYVMENWIAGANDRAWDTAFEIYEKAHGPKDTPVAP